MQLVQCHVRRRSKLSLSVPGICTLATKAPLSAKLRSAERSSPCESGCEWYQHHAPRASEATLSGTTSANASITFSFVGTAVAVFGTLPGADDIRGGTSFYTVDMNDSTSFSFIPPLRAETRLNQVLLYQSPSLANSEHTLFISNEREGRHLLIDFIIYNTSTTSHSHTASSTPVLAGAVTGAAVAGLLVGASAALLFMRRKRLASRKVQNTDAETAESLPTTTASVFTDIEQISSLSVSRPASTVHETNQLGTPVIEQFDGVGDSEIALSARELAVEDDAGTAHRTPDRVSDFSHISSPPPSYKTE